MHDTQSRTESLLDTLKGIQGQAIMLPEFQRDFRWELERSYDLFDSLVKEIFIGTIIYGKPSNIYASVSLERTGKPLGALRKQDV